MQWTTQRLHRQSFGFHQVAQSFIIIQNSLENRKRSFIPQAVIVESGGYARFRTDVQARLRVSFRLSRSEMLRVRISHCGFPDVRHQMVSQFSLRKKT